MSGSAERFEEMGELLAALCEGQIAPHQAARLEQLAAAAPDARRFFLHYVQLHGELVWDQGAASAPSLSDRPVPASGRPGRRRMRTRWAAALVAASLLLALGWGAIQVLRHGGDRTAAAPVVVATLSRAIDAQWGGGAALGEGADLISGQSIQLRGGLAEIAFDSGVRAILDGPARLDLESTRRLFLHHGKLAARVAPQAAGFTVATPSAVVVDAGTEFGVSAEVNGPTEVQVFAGAVEVALPGEAVARPTRALRAGQGIRVVPSGPGEPGRVEPLADAGRERFVRSLPPHGAPCAARLRQIVAQHPRLIHHYPFEGATLPERRRDRRGALHLTEAVMGGGRGGGALAWSVPGVDATTRAVAPWRGARQGNSSGVGLQSEGEFHPPPLMTIELLLRRAPDYNGEAHDVFAAVATRQSRRRCGFLVAAVDQGQLTHLLDGERPWIEAQDGFAFAPGDWYYVAGTFRVEAGRTEINSYAANLSRAERQLTWVVKNQRADGVAPASRLGVGKGFDAELAHAYPWAGELDEIAIYDTVLERATLQEHLESIVGVGHAADAPHGGRTTR